MKLKKKLAVRLAISYVLLHLAAATTTLQQINELTSYGQQYGHAKKKNNDASSLVYRSWVHLQHHHMISVIEQAC